MVIFINGFYHGDRVIDKEILWVIIGLKNNERGAWKYVK